MIWFGNPCDDAIRDAILRGDIGCITTPKQGNVVFPSEWDVIADNGCFGDGLDWDHDRWFRWLLDQPRTIRFVVAPDVFDPDGGECHQATVERWATYGPLIERHGFTPAFVCQVGCTYDTVPADAPVLFLGGTTEFKIGDEARRITAAANADSRWVHMGRVNTFRRLVTATEMGCDSADGTFLKYGPERNLPRILRYLAAAEQRTAQLNLGLFTPTP